MVSIYEVLKEPTKREKYNKVLKDGLPNWKSALYYYRRMRKIGLYEGAAILFLIITVGQYLFAWAAYLEKKYTAEQVLGSKLKKLQKKNRNIDMDTILNEIPAPSLKVILSFVKFLERKKFMILFLEYFTNSNTYVCVEFT